MIGRGQVEAQHPEDRPQKALRLTKGQVKDQAERQRGFDGNLGVLQLPSALADAHGLPRGDRFRRQPQGDVASLDQCSVVRRPVSDAVFRFVPGMHSRLHVEIMPLRPSRWPGPRRTLVSAHQRLGLALRMDHGSQYLSDHFLKQIRYWGIHPSFGFVEEPETNGVAERWNRTLKEQAIHGRIFQNLAAVRAAVADFVERYNQTWRLEKLGYHTPIEAREEYELRQAA